MTCLRWPVKWRYLAVSEATTCTKKLSLSTELMLADKDPGSGSPLRGLKYLRIDIVFATLNSNFSSC